MRRSQLSAPVPGSSTSGSAGLGFELRGDYALFVLVERLP
jgi:hypothetical protein